jgi:hypothetical protein
MAKARPLVFGYAPDAQFASARKAIAAGQAQSVNRLQEEDLRVTPNDTTYTDYYVYFRDGSYHHVLKYVAQYGCETYRVSTDVFSPAGDYYTGSLTASMSSSYSGYNESAACYIGSGGGSCRVPTHAVGICGYPFSATVYTSGTVSHRFPAPCGRYGEPPCQEHFSSTIQINFP